MAKTIEAIVLDKDGYDVDRAEYDTIKAAKSRVKHVLTDEWAEGCETTHEVLGTHKGEVRVNGECVWDVFRRSTERSPRKN